MPPELTVADLPVPNDPWPAIVLMVFSLLAAALLVTALRDWRRSGEPLVLACMVGGLATNPVELIADQLGVIAWAEVNVPIAYRTDITAMPAWLLPSYVVFFGGLIFTMMRFMAGAPTKRQFLAALGACALFNAIIEIPLLAGGFYEYLGSDQPFGIAGLPLIWLFINCGGAILAALIVHSCSGAFRGARAWLIVPLMPACYAAFLCATGWPTFLLLHSDADQWAINAAAVLTCAACLAAYWVLAQWVCRDGRWRAAYERVRGAVAAAPAPAPREVVGVK